MSPFSKVLRQSRQTFALFSLANSLAWAATFLSQACFSKVAGCSSLNLGLAFVLGLAEAHGVDQGLWPPGSLGGLHIHLRPVLPLLRLLCLWPPPLELFQAPSAEDMPPRKGLVSLSPSFRSLAFSKPFKRW